MAKPKFLSGDFLALVKFLHKLAFWVGFALLLFFMYETIKAYPKEPSFNFKIPWIILSLGFLAFFIYSLPKAWSYRPHLHFRDGRIRRPQTPEDREMAERWKKIREKAFSGSQDEMKQSILEADKIADKALENHGFTAENTEGKLLQIMSEDLGWIRSIGQKANNFRNKIANDPSIEVERSDVKRAIQNYEALLDELDVIDRRNL